MKVKCVQKRSATELKGLAEGNYNDLMEQLVPELAEALQNPTKGIPCPCHGDKDGFNLGSSFNETGRGYCQLTGSKDIFAILEMFNGWTFKEALANLNACLEGDSVPGRSTAERKERTAKAQTKKIEELKATEGALHAIWAQTRTANGVLLKYLQSRGIAGPIPRFIRLHPGLKYWEQDKNRNPVHVGTFPAMVAKVVSRGKKPGPKGPGWVTEEITRLGEKFVVEKMVGLHITYLNPDGSGLADVPSPRKMRSCSLSFSGGVIPLHEHNYWPGTFLLAGEGIETCLAAHKITGKPVYCAMTAGGLQRVKLPDFIEKVQILADRDLSGAGEKAAEELRIRLESDGKFVKVMMPGHEIPEGAKSFDWNDFLLMKVGA